MVTVKPSSNPPQNPYVQRLEAGEALLSDSELHLLEVVGILKSYGVVLDAYSRNLIYTAENQFLIFFPFFKYFNGEVSLSKLLKHWRHNRLNYEYAEYCGKSMYWHGGGGLASFVDELTFKPRVEPIIQRKFRHNPLVRALHRTFPEFLPEQMRLMAYFHGLGQFWRVMSDMFLALYERYEQGKITAVPDVVDHIREGLVAAAGNPVTYSVTVGHGSSGPAADHRTYDVIPKSAGLTFLPDLAVPYVEAIFFRGTPFPGTISYNAQAYQIPLYKQDFTYGALYADPLPIGGSGIPPTQLMQDMRHFLPDALQEFYRHRGRGEDDIKVKICETFQKSMFCVTTAAIQGLAPFPFSTEDPSEQEQNRAYLKGWIDRLQSSRLDAVQ
ncbi:MAG: CO2 hydration protein [Elainellaceae cyanobacterium]